MPPSEPTPETIEAAALTIATAFAYEWVFQPDAPADLMYGAAYWRHIAAESLTAAAKASPVIPAADAESQHAAEADSLLGDCPCDLPHGCGGSHPECPWPDAPAHDCDAELRADPTFRPSQCRPATFLCSCGKQYAHVCDEAEGCWWEAMKP